MSQSKFEKSYKAVRERRLKRWDDLLKFYRMTPEDKTPKIKRFMRKGTAEKHKILPQLRYVKKDSVKLLVDPLKPIDLGFW